jgi:hypothetical protein
MKSQPFSIYCEKFRLDRYRLAKLLSEDAAHHLRERLATFIQHRLPRLYKSRNPFIPL